MTEQQLQSKILAYLKKNRRDIFVLRVTTCNVNGFPDLALFHKGQVFCVELKAKGKKPRPLQVYVHEELDKRAGVTTYVLDDFQDFLEILPN